MIINRWQCWIKTILRTILFPEELLNGQYVSGHNFGETEKHLYCTVCRYERLKELEKEV